MPRMLAGSIAGFLFWAGGVQAEPAPFDFSLNLGTRLEFYRLSDFGPPGSECHACRVPNHVNCDQSCYQVLPSLGLACASNVQAVSIGPFARADRIHVLDELFKNDEIAISTLQGFEYLEARHVSSVIADNGEEAFIDVEGLEGLKNTLTRAADSHQYFSVRVGTETYRVALNFQIQEDLYRFIKQCPD